MASEALSFFLGNYFPPTEAKPEHGNRVFERVQGFHSPQHTHTLTSLLPYIQTAFEKTISESSRLIIDNVLLQCEEHVYHRCKALKYIVPGVREKGLKTSKGSITEEIN